MMIPVGAHRAMRQADVLIVGGGPVGLWTAIQVKIRCAKAQVFVLEESVQYHCRKEIQLCADFFEGSAWHPHLSQRVVKPSSSGVATHTLENRLTRLANRVGVRILRPFKVTAPEELPFLCPQAQFFISADGGQEATRECWFPKGRRVQRVSGEAAFALVGAAAIPGVREGFLCATRLAQIVAQAREGDDLSVLNDYERYVDSLRPVLQNKEPKSASRRGCSARSISGRSAACTLL